MECIFYIYNYCCLVKFRSLQVTFRKIISVEAGDTRRTTTEHITDNGSGRIDSICKREGYEVTPRSVYCRSDGKKRVPILQ